MKANHSFEHELWKCLKASEDHLKSSFVLAVSGGCDSMALLASFAQVIPADRLTVVTIHHGNTEDSLQQKFREDSYQYVIHFCEEKKLRCVSHRLSSSESQSEGFYRDQRYLFLRKIKQEVAADWIVTAHHQEDLLETRVLRLLRGTGGQGLGAIKFKENDLMRPFLSTSKVQMKNYLQDQKIIWIEDPSNQNTEPFRNWIRQELFPFIAKRDASALNNLHRSLQLISEELDQETSYLKKEFSDNGISRQDFILGSSREQEKMLGAYLRSREHIRWTAGLLSEIRKNIDRNNSDFEFSVGPLHWKISSKWIELK